LVSSISRDWKTCAKTAADSGLQDRDNTPEYIEVDADDDLDAPIPEHPSNAATVFPTVIELPSLTLKCGVVRPRDTIEMEGTTERDSNSLISGDFLRIEKIIEDVETGEVKLRGYRLRRENTLRPQFKGKMVMLLYHSGTDV
jgi:DNA (cytosine-5)-methyltransferase 1